MAQAVSRWPLTAEAGFAPGSIHVGFVVDKVALGQVFLRVLRFSPANIIPPLLHIRLSPPHEVCDSSDEAEHYHHLGNMLGASFLTRNFDWKQNKKESINRNWLMLFSLNTSGMACRRKWKPLEWQVSPVPCKSQQLL
jgi:hypothetical protein